MNVGDRFDVNNPQMHSFTVEVYEIVGQKAKIGYADSLGGYGQWIPLASLRHMKADLNGYVLPGLRQIYKRTGNRDIDLAMHIVLTNRGEYLGKGDDGVVFRADDYAVKMSTTVPYHPFNQGHRTPSEAIAMLREQTDVARTLVSKGVPHVVVPAFVTVGEKAFQIRPYYDLPKTLKPLQLAQVADAVGAIWQAGYGLRDSTQVGLDRRGDVVLFDIGKAAPIAPYDRRKAPYNEIESEIENLRYFYRDQGATLLDLPPGSAALTVWEVTIQPMLRHPGPWYDAKDIEKVKAYAALAQKSGVPNAVRDALAFETACVDDGRPHWRKGSVK